MRIIVNDTSYSTHFKQLLYSFDRYIIAFGGRGSGKTETFYLKYLLALFEPYYFKLAYINKEFSNIRDAQYSGFKRVAKRVGLYDKLRFYDGTYQIINPQNGNALIPKGMDDPEKTKGLDDITAIWWDEISKGTEEDFTTLNALLRTPQAKYLQFAMSFNPVSETHWLRNYFFEEKEPYKLKEYFAKETLLNHSTYLNNEFIDQSEYLRTLELNAQGNVNRMLVDIEGKWGIENVVNPFFYAFSYDIHYIDDYYNVDQSKQLILSFDFNNNPTTLVVGQVVNKRISIIDVILTNENSIKGASPLEAACMLFNKKYIDSGITIPPYLIVTGDASGRSKGADNVANKNFYSKIQHLLRLGNGQIKVRKSNISHALSRELCNGLIFNTEFNIYKSAYMAVEDMMSAYVDNQNSLNKAKKELGLHITDAVRYFMDCVLNFDKWKEFLLYYKRN